MNLEAFCRVLPLLVKRVGAFFFLVAGLYASPNHFLWRGKGLLVAAKILNSDGYLALQKTCIKDLHMLVYL